MKSTVGEIRDAVVQWSHKTNTHRVKIKGIEYKGGELLDEQTLSQLAKEDERIFINTELKVGCLIL
jgi:hypothetical protein